MPVKCTEKPARCILLGGIIRASPTSRSPRTHDPIAVNGGCVACRSTSNHSIDVNGQAGGFVGSVTRESPWVPRHSIRILRFKSAGSTMTMLPGQCDVLALRKVSGALVYLVLIAVGLLSQAISILGS
eukprot:scaffold6241_cov129-Cylindrotheca_fusiformis.AAC.2